MLPNGMLLGAQSRAIGGYPAGVQIRDAHYGAFARREICEIHTTSKQSRAFYSFLKAQIGKPYDHSAIWGFAMGRDWRQDDSWICSELQAAALEHAGIVPELYLATNKISPVALAFGLSFLGFKASN